MASVTGHSAFRLCRSHLLAGWSIGQDEVLNADFWPDWRKEVCSVSCDTHSNSHLSRVWSLPLTTRPHPVCPGPISVSISHPMCPGPIRVSRSHSCVQAPSHVSISHPVCPSPISCVRVPSVCLGSIPCVRSHPRVQLRLKCCHAVSMWGAVIKQAKLLIVLRPNAYPAREVQGDTVHRWPWHPMEGDLGDVIEAHPH